MRTPLRTQETHDRYESAPKTEECFICSSPILIEYKYWIVIENDFPYDSIAEVHRMIVPRRHIANRGDLTAKELKQLDDIKKNLDEEGFYDALFENFTAGRTFLEHYHLHLLKWKRI